MSHLLDDEGVLERTIELARAFGAPLHVMNREVDGAFTFQSSAEQMGVISISSELGGGNRVSLEGVAIARRGVVNAMLHLGMMEGKIAASEDTHLKTIPSSGDYGFAPAAGIYCPTVPLGTMVESGQTLGHIYRIEDPTSEPLPITAARPGLLWCQRGQGRIDRGDSAAVIVSDWNQSPSDVDLDDDMLEVRPS
jgi:predicted deacylase